MDYFIKATEFSIDVVYLDGDEEKKKTVPRGQIFEFDGVLVSSCQTPDTPLVSQSGAAGGLDTPAREKEPVVEEPTETKEAPEQEEKAPESEAPAEKVAEEPAKEEVEAKAPAKRGRKPNAAKEG